MDRFPTEIICSILLQSLPTKDERREYSTKTFMKMGILAPVRISHVCRAWRQIALGYSGLWNHLFIHHEPRRRIRLATDKATEVCNAWLSRSRNRPLNVYFHCDLTRRATAEDHRFAQQFIEALYSQQHRWEHVDFEWFGVNVSHEFPRLELKDMPMLISFKADITLWVPGGSLSPVSVDITRSPKLRELKFNGDLNITIGEPQHRPSLRSCKLTFFARNHLHAFQLCETLLTSAPPLEEFNVSMHVPNRSAKFHFWDDIRLFLPSLRALGLDLRSASIPLIDCLTLPSLSALSYFDESETAGMKLLSFVQRSLPPLISLILNGEAIDEDVLKTVLRALPSLERLSVADPVIAGDFFLEFAVTGDPEEQVLCPALRTLSLDRMWIQLGDEEDSTTFKNILLMVTSRRRAFGTCDLASYRLITCDEIEISPSSFDELRHRTVTGRGTELYIRTSQDV